MDTNAMATEAYEYIPGVNESWIIDGPGPVETEPGEIKIDPNSVDYAGGYHAGFSAANEILEFAKNVNLLIGAIIDSPFASMLTAGNPDAKKAMKALKDSQ